jgi:2'-5' RNA ligase
MNIYRLPACVVLEIAPPVSEAIQSIRDSLDSLTSRLPVEITIAGSSGLGPIPIGTDKSKTENSLKTLLNGFEPFRVRFQEIRCFPNTDIFYLAPQERQPFDSIHQALKESEIPFSPSPWPYNPHCTLRASPKVDRISTEEIFRLPFPKEEFVIDTLSVYELNPQTLTCHLSFQAKMSSHKGHD